MSVTFDELEELLRLNYPILYVNRFIIPNSQVANHLRDYISLSASESSIDAKEIVAAYAQTCFEFLILQERFRETGHYSAASQEEIRRQIYSDSQKSENYRLGLLLTYAWWENHFKIAENFYTRAVKNPSVKSVLEIGVGHAFFAYMLLREKSELRYVGIDISESAINKAQEVLPISTDMQKIEFIVKDATKERFYDDDLFDLVICCEVLEHVEDPLSLAQTIHNLLSGKGFAFITTVCNLEAIDHIFLFRNIDEIHQIFLQANLEVLSEDRLELNEFQDGEFEEINYWAVLKRV